MTREQLRNEIQDHKDTIERVEDDLSLWRILGRPEDIAECERILAEERGWLQECLDDLNALGTDNHPDFSAISRTPTNQ